MRIGRRILGFGRGWVERRGGRILKGVGVSEVGVGEGRKVRRRGMIGKKKAVCMDEEMEGMENKERLAFFRIFNLIPEGSEEGFNRHVCVVLWILHILATFFLSRLR